MSDNSGLLKYMIAATGLVINIMTICFIYDAYTEYRDLGAIREITIQTLVPFIILSIIASILRYLLHKYDDMPTLEFWFTMFLWIMDPRFPYGSVRRFGREASHSFMWKKLGHGISLKHLFFLILFLILTGISILGAYYVWIYKDAGAGVLNATSSEHYQSSFVMHILLICVFLVHDIKFFVRMVSVGQPIIEYIVIDYLKFEDVNEDFSNAIYCGGYIWIGEKYIYIRTCNEGNILGINYVDSVEEEYVFGFIRKIIIKGRGKTIHKYVIGEKIYKTIDIELNRIWEKNEKK